MNFLNEASDSKFVTRKLNISNDQSNANYDVGNKLSIALKYKCTCARIMGKSPDVQFEIWFYSWNVGSISGKSEKYLRV